MNYWSYRIHKAGYQDGNPIFVAEYVAETSPEAVKKDLANHHSRLRDYLMYSSGIDAEEYARKFAIRTEALLGGLAACSDCSFRFGIWLPVQAPTPLKCKAPTSEPVQSPFAANMGVKLWLITQSEKITDDRG